MVAHALWVAARVGQRTFRTCTIHRDPTIKREAVTRMIGRAATLEKRHGRYSRPALS